MKRDILFHHKRYPTETGAVEGRAFV